MTTLQALKILKSEFEALMLHSHNVIVKNVNALALFSTNYYICFIISGIKFFRFKLLAVCQRWRTAFFYTFMLTFLHKRLHKIKLFLNFVYTKTKQL